jgi:hypothetical protein
VSVALDAKLRYFGTRLSDNIAETPEGYLICKDAIIGRSGFQDYFVSELTDPEGLLKDRDPGEELPVYRDPSEVFSPSTLSSFEGKTFTVTHPDNLLDPDNDGDHHVGHAQNIRKGSEPLESGDWPMLADIIVKGADAIQRIRNGERQLSCGYAYKLAKNGNGFEQRNIIGNHVALVPKGRAGADARINDAAPDKEVRPVKTDWLKKIKALGLKAFAVDATPEDLATAMDELAAPVAAPAVGGIETMKFIKIGKTADGVDIFKSVAADEEPSKADKEKEAKEKESKEKADKEKADKAKDAAACAKCGKSGDACTCVKGKDADPDEHGAKMHAAVDRLIAAQGKKAEMEDADMAELKELMGQYLGEEENEPEHQGDNEVAPISMSDEKGKEDNKEKGEDGEIVEPEPVLSPEDLPQSQFDAAAVVKAHEDGARAALKALRPIIARCKDKAVVNAFNTALDSVPSKAKDAVTGSGKGSYAAVTAASQRSTVGDGKSLASMAETPLQKSVRETDEMYKAQMASRSLRGKQGKK